MTREEAATFAANWAAAWNERAIERVLAHFQDDVAFTSPTASAVVGVATVSGKAALRDYWTTALARITSLRFTIDRVVWDPATRELAIVYWAEINGASKRVSENLTFGPDGLVRSAEVFHGVDASEAVPKGDAQRRHDALLTAVAAAINGADPMNLLRKGSPFDEYAPELGTIVPRVVSATGLDDVRRIVHQEFEHWFGRDVGPVEAYDTLARAVWEAVVRFRADAG